ncbi:uncharacterized protein Z520_06552 [Fonsecaea multimorphosa CBS 102226]|uniref:Thioesterase domain-containing protein n=1 Tax=Fonsecaea multimorphosa CBS 102226 TaxID=1442371 RepID=A0A0D2K3L7_9EURO|nr:uncharacterized protein Z520_06552 [Fonsecaea multimorphosa CBS 102226]KIX97774.1 hypothetical protein Z520_06552 [Fonsecaea multimorphosa CBS 102226]OAL23794.1 hypothetical protein AYO22_06113 [Fonsecaea multimorphosa]
MGSADQDKPGSTPAATLEHFQSIPWCRPHLADPTFRRVSMSRTLTQPGHGHSLMAETWNTDKTITHLLSMYRPPGPEGESANGQTTAMRGEVKRFYTFGIGMNAHPATLHGGVIATVLDSTMGNVIGQQLRHGSAPTFTVALNISYKKPVATPGTVMARAWITKVDGDRKIWVHGVVEDGRGNVHAEADGMWLRAKAKL